MPIFEYQCESCAHIEELLQKHGAAAPELCPECKAAGTMHKKISMTSFQLKGGGWFKDLYASTPKSDGKSSSSEKATKSSPGSDQSSSDKSSGTSEKPSKPSDKSSTSKKTGAAA